MIPVRTMKNIPKSQTILCLSPNKLGGSLPHLNLDKISSLRTSRLELRRQKPIY
ncbi:hypothetical protein PL9214640546 [Planktothrix tepida PCC 9214]|uniref:Uncharacterized protein n=1 Tax=Planktothrix tepida PCC 9214 TaxID=671072 RepID=A0A1J1LPU3_9CYAN|nr:hypothetical protein PL9214640546 [Planktothrix tepida PCC 9214]